MKDPYERVRAIREVADVEKPACDYAESRGWFQVKIEKTSRRGFPDRYFIRKGVTILAEFKKPGKYPEPIQDETIKELTDHGAEVHVIDNMRYALALFR